MAATIKDVARLAGVSHTTVSMVIHKDKRITSATKEKVEKAIKKLNYHPNYMARSLVRGKSNSVAVVATYFSSMFEVNFLKGLESGSSDNPYNINQYSTRGRAESKQEILQSLLYGKMADAVIILSIRPDDNLMEEYRKSDIPVILIEERAPGASTIMSDNYKGAYDAASYLADKGKRNIALIAGSGEEEQGLSPAERKRGFVAALHDKKIDVRNDLFYAVKNYIFEDGVNAVKQFLRSSHKPDAVFCAAGDLVALGAIKEAENEGFKVPDDIPVIGYDDIEFAPFFKPPLTTVKQPVFEMGKRAFNIAVDLIKNPSSGPVEIIFDTELIIRESA